MSRVNKIHSTLESIFTESINEKWCVYLMLQTFLLFCLRMFSKFYMFENKTETTVCFSVSCARFFCFSSSNRNISTPKNIRPWNLILWKMFGTYFLLQHARCKESYWNIGDIYICLSTVRRGVCIFLRMFCKLHIFENKTEYILRPYF